MLLALAVAATISGQVSAPATCQVKGVVREAKVLPRYELGCVKTGDCPKGVPTSAPERYWLKIKVSEINEGNCRLYYPIGETAEIFLKKDRADNISKDMVIEGTTSFDGVTNLTLKGTATNSQTINAPGDQKITPKRTFWDRILNAIRTLFFRAK